MRVAAHQTITKNSAAAGGSAIVPLDATPHEPAARQGWYALGVLILVALFNYIDRQSLAILQIPIKHELGLSDTQLGALTGLSFALLYSTLALPIARLADRSRRVWLIAAALGVWSLMTGATGWAVGMMTLTLCRMGVALGEAGCVPATHSLISDLFPPQRRATAIATWTLSFPLGTMLGFAAGGWLSSAFGWRRAFMVLGAAGLCLIPLLLTVREPRRGATDTHPTVGVAAARPSLRAALNMLWSLRAFRHATLAGALLDFTLYATLNWNAPFYNRSFGLTAAELGPQLALLSGLGSGLGVYFGGLIADRLARRDKRWYMWVPAFAAIGAVPFMCAQYFAPSWHGSLLLGYVPAILLSSFLAPLVATAQSLVPATLRAFTSAVLVLVVNIIGLGLGPLVTGLLSDLLTTRYGMGLDGLRYALIASAIPALWSAVHFARAAHFLRAELAQSSNTAGSSSNIAPHLRPGLAAEPPQESSV
jgi:MFS family permease